MKYWLMKSEPDVFSIDDLKEKKVSLWDGVRNYQARNFMTNEMRVGDLALFYHSNANPSGVVGLAKIAEAAVPDPTQFDKKSVYYDARSKKDHPRWFCVKVQYQDHFKNFVSLDEIKKTKELKNMILLRRSRLSIQPVTAKEFKTICALGGLKNL